MGVCIVSFWLRVRLWFFKLWVITPCMECYRGRVFLFGLLGALASVVLPAVFVVACCAVGMLWFAGRKNNWWLK